MAPFSALLNQCPAHHSNKIAPKKQTGKEAVEILELWRLLENLQMQGSRNPEKSPLKSGIFQRRTCMVVAVTCPVESA